MRWDLINEMIDNYEGENLLEDTKLALAQAVVNRVKTKKEAISLLGVPQTTLDSWFRKGWLVKPVKFTKKTGRFKKGEPRDPLTEKKRLEGLQNYFLRRRSNAGP